MVKVMLKKEQKFLADWYETYKYDFEYAMYEMISCFRSLPLEENKFIELYGEEMFEWHANLENKPIQTLVEMNIFGYEFYN